MLVGLICLEYMVAVAAASSVCALPKQQGWKRPFHIQNASLYGHILALARLHAFAILCSCMNSDSQIICIFV